MSQEEAASRLGLSVSAYAALELGYATALRADEVMSLIGPLGPLNPTVGELCVLARRRSGENVHQVTEAIGYSRVSYFRFERDGDPRVVSFWEDRGFRFPQARAVGAVPEGRPGTVPYRAKS
jgi:DNA-binding XRE family transcriptional regulator